MSEFRLLSIIRAKTAAAAAKLSYAEARAEAAVAKEFEALDEAMEAREAAYAAGQGIEEWAPAAAKADACGDIAALKWLHVEDLRSQYKELNEEMTAIALQVSQREEAQAAQREEADAARRARNRVRHEAWGEAVAAKIRAKGEGAEVWREARHEVQEEGEAARQREEAPRQEQEEEEEAEAELGELKCEARQELQHAWDVLTSGDGRRDDAGPAVFHKRAAKPTGEMAWEDALAAWLAKGEHALHRMRAAAEDLPHGGQSVL
jgi:hypothetical protein